MSKMGTKKLWPAAAAQVHPAAMTPFWVGVHSKRPWSAARRVITLWDKTWIEFLLLIKYNKPWINNKHSEIRFSNSKYKLPRYSQLHIMMVESYQQTWHLEKKVYNYSKGQFSRFRLYYDFFTSTYLTNFKIFSLATDFWKRKISWPWYVWVFSKVHWDTKWMNDYIRGGTQWGLTLNHSNLTFKLQN